MSGSPSPGHDQHRLQFRLVAHQQGRPARFRHAGEVRPGDGDVELAVQQLVDESGVVAGGIYHHGSAETGFKMSYQRLMRFEQRHRAVEGHDAHAQGGGCLPEHLHSPEGEQKADEPNTAAGGHGVWVAPGGKPCFFVGVSILRLSPGRDKRAYDKRNNSSEKASGLCGQPARQAKITR